jgi:ubiquinone/menaquinone biosynthesis C-methylase UbiE
VSEIQRVQREFAKQASGFGDLLLTVARRDYVEWMIGHLPIGSAACVLDVCAGTGHVSRAIAPRVRRVVAVDVTVEMLRELATQATVDRLLNLSPVRAIAEALPIRDATFDVVVARFALHHVSQPAVVVAEMARTCRRGGTVGVIDLVAPDDPALAERYNHYERLRDPSHTRALNERELQALVEGAGLQPVTFARREIEVGIDAWLGLAKTASADAVRIRRDLLAELEGRDRTGMRPFRRGDELAFLQRWVVSVAGKP